RETETRDNDETGRAAQCSAGNLGSHPTILSRLAESTPPWVKRSERCVHQRRLQRSLPRENDDARQVFWLSDRSTNHAFSAACMLETAARHAREWPLWCSSPITAAGPRWNCTTFPGSARGGHTGHRSSYQGARLALYRSRF